MCIFKQQKYYFTYSLHCDHSYKGFISYYNMYDYCFSVHKIVFQIFSGFYYLFMDYNSNTQRGVTPITTKSEELPLITVSFTNNSA